MRKLMTSLVVLWAAAVYAQDKTPPADSNERILEELRQLRAEVAELKKMIRDLEQGSRTTADPPAPNAFTERRGADREALSRIKLSENPTREEMLEYVDAITLASRGQNSYGSEDPQVGMLVKLGRKNVDVLVEAYDEGACFYFDYALRRLAGKEHKDLVIGALAEHPNLAAIVLDKGWADDAREILTDALTGRPNYLPTEWIAAVASLRDPATYDDLVAYFIGGMNKPNTYDAIRALPGIDVDAAVAEAWERPRGSFPSSVHEKKSLAPIAIAHGIGDALETAFGLLGGEKWLAERAREAILRHTEAVGSDEELQAFHEKHKGRFRWDKDRRKFLAESP